MSSTVQEIVRLEIDAAVMRDNRIFGIKRVKIEKSRFNFLLIEYKE